MSTAAKRAEMPEGTNTILDKRTIFNANRNLLEIIKEGNHVLDVGCGSGSITKGIAELTGESGKVVGIDCSDHLIRQAKNNFYNISNLTFENADIFSYSTSEKYDVISAARVLQWLSDPEGAVSCMIRLLKPGGCISILDYNHERIEWSPKIPDSMLEFYFAFLRWRADSGMNNAIADHLPELFEKLGLKDITISDQSEFSQRSSISFYDDAAIWAKVAASRGKQLVADHYISEALRTQAIDDYFEWIDTRGKSMKLYLRSVSGWTKK